MAFPTETVYGLGADAFNPTAAARIFEIKGRPSFDPLIVHLHRLEQLELLIEMRRTASLSAQLQQLAEAFWPGPLTIVLPKNATVPDIVTAGLPTVAVRMPEHPVALELLRLAGTPIAAPSANRFGAVSPTTAAHVRGGLGSAVDCILDGGPCAAGIESTIIALSAEGDSLPILLRPGATPLEAIEKLLGPLGGPAPTPTPAAPGMLKSHYATRTPLRLLDLNDEVDGSSRIAAVRALIDEHSHRGLLCLGSQLEQFEGVSFQVTETLASGDDLSEAAVNLFAAMHRLDAAGLDLIIAIKVPELGLGRAINDRLRRAASV